MATLYSTAERPWQEWSCDLRGEAVSRACPINETVFTGQHMEIVLGQDQVTALEQDQAHELKTPGEWYALQTHFRHEKQVRDRLLAVGLEPLLPLGKQCRQWSDRKVWMNLPLFAGYCFARLALDNSLAVLRTPGVIRIVGTPKPEPIPAEEIAAIQQICSVNRMIESCDYLIEGSWVEVVRGPLTGLRGQLVRRSNHHAIVIRAHLIQQAALVHIEADEVVSLQ